MTATPSILAIDQGTTSSRAIVFNDQSEALHVARQEFTQHYPAEGWVEHDPEAIWSSVLSVTQKVLSQTDQPPVVIGITNQRETTVIWDRASGVPIYNAIVWQDRRTTHVCESLRNEGHEADITARTGLLLDPYFSASKIAWILDHVNGARARATSGDLAFGTIDTFLLWRLTGGRMHATDATNASRTALFNIHEQCWDSALLEHFDVPEAILPQVLDTADHFGTSDPDVLGESIMVGALVGDQQAALVGQGCLKTGMLKSTYSRHRLLTTVGYRLD